MSSGGARKPLGRWGEDLVAEDLRRRGCVILASDGYPQKYQSGFEMTIAPEALPHAFVAGAKLADGKLLTSGGRVIGLTAVEDTLPQAIEEAYTLTGMVHFENAYCRRDIGARAMKAFKEA